MGKHKKQSDDVVEIGHNSEAQLKSIIERVERLEEEKATIAEDIKEVYAEAKANGYDVPTLRMIVKLRKEDTAERQAREALLELYMHKLGMLSDTPLGKAALRAEFGDEAVAG